MPKPLFRKLPCFGLPLALSLAVSAAAQVSKPAITLEQQPSSEIAGAPLSAQEKSAFSNPSAKLPENFHVFKSVNIGESGYLEPLTLHFDMTAKLTGIESTPDFKVEPGGSCVEGSTYTANSTCSLLVRFTPNGPGPRSGKLTITHSASAKPMYVGLGGYGSGPIVSFTPAVISTVPTSYPSNKGLFSGATNLAVDSGDTVYVADTGNNQIRFLNASGAFQNFTGQFKFTGPIEIAVDDFGTVIETQVSPGLFIVTTYNGATSYASNDSSACNIGQTCDLFNPGVNFYTPGTLAYDRNGNTFANASYSLFRLSQGTDGFLAGTPLESSYGYGYDLPLAVDANDNTYTYYQSYGTCLINSQSYYSATNSLNQYRKVAGGSSACGFGGDGGQARNALISTNVGQMTFDIAGNLYFSDAGNQRVRRIDASTGIITTIAGTGTAGYSGDGGPATKAALSSPTGVGVDSQGQVYILSGAAATGSSQVMRKVGPNGLLAFGNQLKGTASAALPVTVANTGNAELEWTSVLIEGPNASDFSIDPTTTSCFLTSGSTLQAGESCRIGILFKPTASGSRSANLVFIDNTVTTSNTVQLSGVGTMPVPTVTITAPASGVTETAGQAFPFSVTVTSTTSPAPTGTVKFTVNGTAVGNPVTLASGAASISLTETTAGSYTLAATYSGDANYAASGPVGRTVTVAAAAKAVSTATLKAKMNPASTCEAIAFSVAVASKAAVLPTGKVELMEGSTVLATGTVSNGSVTLTAPKLAAGTHVLKANYLGDSQHAASSSPALKETVEATACLIERKLPKLPKLRVDPLPSR